MRKTWLMQARCLLDKEKWADWSGNQCGGLFCSLVGPGRILVDLRAGSTPDVQDVVVVLADYLLCY